MMTGPVLNANTRINKVSADVSDFTDSAACESLFFAIKTASYVKLESRSARIRPDERCPDATLTTPQIVWPTHNVA